MNHETMNLRKFRAALLCVSLLGLPLSACQKQPGGDPPASSSAPASSASTSAPGDASSSAGSSSAAADLILPKAMFLSGHTGVGAAKLLADNEDDDPSNDSLDSFSIVDANDQVVAALNSGEVDIAAIATNMAATLYNRTDGNITMLAVNTYGVLYILEKGESVQSVADLAGKTIYATGQGANPEYILNYVLTQNHLDPAADVTIQWLTPQEITAKMSSEDAGVCMLPVPAATGLLLKDSGVRQALDLSAEWDKVSSSPLAMGCVAVRTAFLKENPDSVAHFLDCYEDSIRYMSDPANLDQAAELVAQYGITANAAIAKAAIPQCNLAFLTGDEMRDTIQNYFSVLNSANPDSIGGAMPYDDFYYLP